MAIFIDIGTFRQWANMVVLPSITLGLCTCISCIVAAAVGQSASQPLSSSVEELWHKHETCCRQAVSLTAWNSIPSTAELFHRASPETHTKHINHPWLHDIKSAAQASVSLVACCPCVLLQSVHTVQDYKESLRGDLECAAEFRNCADWQICILRRTLLVLCPDPDRVHHSCQHNWAKISSINQSVFNTSWHPQCWCLTSTYNVNLLKIL